MLLLQPVGKHIDKLKPKFYKTKQCNGNGWDGAELERGAEEELGDRWHFNSDLSEKRLVWGDLG